jgi:hypothetical protein
MLELDTLEVMEAQRSIWKQTQSTPASTLVSVRQRVCDSVANPGQ